MEIEDLRNKIRFLRDYVRQLTNEVSVASKQHRSQNPNPSSPNNNFVEDETITFDETGDLKAATVERLVEALYKDILTKTATEYAHVFLLTYRSFATPRQVLDKLQEGYIQLQNTVSNDSIKCRLR